MEHLLAACAFVIVLSLPIEAFASDGCLAPASEVNGPSGQPLTVDQGGGRDRQLYEESHALLIGQSQYPAQSGWRALPHVPVELDALGGALRTQGFHVVRYDDLSSAQLAPAIECFVRQYGYRREARIVIYFAGHGFTRTDVQSGGERTVGYVLPIDTPPPPKTFGGKEEADIVAKALRLTQFQEWASAMESRHVLLIFDSCFSGSVLGHRGEELNIQKPQPLNYVLSVSAQSSVRWFLTSGTAKQTVPAESIFNSLLVQALIGLRPEADVNHDGFLTTGELVTYLKVTVPEYNFGQTPDDGRIREPLLDVGDMAFRIPNRESAAAVFRAANHLESIELSGQHLDQATVRKIADPNEAKPVEPTALALSDQSVLANAIQNLESSNTANRRQARVELSNLMRSNGAGFIGEIVRGMPHNSYRYQIGVAEALSNLPAGWRADDQPQALNILTTRLNGTDDASLKKAVTGAILNAGGKTSN